jgi:hypothetical protein
MVISGRAPRRGARSFGRIVFGLVIMTIMVIAILIKPAKWLTDFDQVFYLTIAYDLDRHRVFSNGPFDAVNSSVAAPAPGMFFAPVYPLLVLAASKVDRRFAKALDCAIEANHKMHDGARCEVYARPMHLLHAASLTVGILAIALAAEAIFASSLAFWLAGILATLALIPEANLFSFVMTESVTFSLYSIAALALVRALQAPRMRNFVLAGCLFGLLCLTRTSFVVLALAVPALIALHGWWLPSGARRTIPRQVMAFALGWLLIVGPWVVRNGVSVGKWGLTEEYGSVALIERFAFNHMSVREYLLAFPYCLPEIGEPAVKQIFGPHAMDRFVYTTPGSFFDVGRRQRDALIAAHGRLDPLISGLILDEMRERGWRYLLVIAPLAWCGMWVGGILGLLLVPMFAAACIWVLHRSAPLFLIYAAPAFVMLGLHAAVANHYTRYNLILLGPFCAGSAWIMTRMSASLFRRGRQFR